MTTSGTSPALTVVMPVWNGASVLHRSLDALEASQLSPHLWELIVVDDGSRDTSPQLAEERGHTVVRVEGGPRGPAHARNKGAERANGRILVFVDADVCVHPDTLARFLRLFDEHSDLGAAFGAYDALPADTRFLSQYRNLYHRYVHLRGAGKAETFWAGCGAVRRDVFEDVGGFDADRYPRPAVEDIELGYRIRGAGWNILLDPGIQGTHLKRWTLGDLLVTDLVFRGIPWMRLLLEESRRPSLNVGSRDRLRVLLVGMGGLALVAGLAFGTEWLLVGAALLTLAVLANASLHRWFAEARGWGFSARAVPFTLMHDAVSCVSVAIAVVGHLAARPRFRGLS